MASKNSYMGSIELFAGDKPPKGWAKCEGQTLSVQNYMALYNVIGTSFGGTGNNFNLPDLRCRVPIGEGKGTGLTQRYLGEKSGSEQVNLTIQEVGLHTHTLRCDNSPGKGNLVEEPKDNFPSIPNDGEENKHFSTLQNGLMAEDAVDYAGGDRPHNNVQKFIALNYIICIQGKFPPYLESENSGGE